jgi:hypothetical protein
MLFDPGLKSLAAARKRHGIPGQLAAFEPYVKEVPYICPSLPEIDLPMSIPSNAHLVGPILLPTQPLSQSDPDLIKWLQKGPTVLLNLGSFQEGTIDQARGMALGLRVLFDSNHEVQVLWKFRPAKGSNADQEIEAILGREIRSNRIKVQSWLNCEPLSILQSGFIVAAVHHGGANSWFEATWYLTLFSSNQLVEFKNETNIDPKRAGIPQVVLPQWYDTYDYASKAEYLGLGIYGNKSCAPMVDANEFGNALLRVVGDAGMREKARELGEVCQDSGGRTLAASLIGELTDQA